MKTSAAKRSRRAATRKIPRVLITAGPTREYFDSVRFISNASSGKMGTELTKAFIAKKARVSVVAGPCPAIFPSEANVTRVVSAAQMLSAVKKLSRNADFIVAAAAVSDYAPSVKVSGKLKKNKAGLSVGLLITPDILETISALKYAAGRRPVIVGFALETAKRLLSDAKKKLAKKRCDFVVANTPDAMESGRSSGAILFGDGSVSRFNNICKGKLAAIAAREALKIWSTKNS
ncbi:MAG TPA: hypothetical protein DCX95_02865 [Elusimicrobia bacterium]|nr:hypothetical protein [Elusimicrobiota bacterium]